MKKLWGVTVEAGIGSLLKADVDAIVNAANSDGIMGNGMACAIRLAGGDEIESEAVAKAPIKIGDAVITTGGKLRQKVIHAPTMTQPGPTTTENVMRAALAALECADKNGLKSIAMSGIGTGMGRVPHDHAAEVIVGAIGEFAKKGGGLERVVLVDLDEKMAQAFQRALEKV